MPIQQMMLGGGGGVTDLASFFGLSPTAQADIKIRPLMQRFTFDTNNPGQGWDEVPQSATGEEGWFLSAVGRTDADGLGMWKTASGSTVPMPTTVSCDSVPSTSTNNWY